MSCPVARTSHLIGKKWAIPVIEEIALGRMDSFNSFLKKEPKITARILSLQIKELENEDLIKKHFYKKNNRVTGKYSLTQKGQEMHSLITEIKKWDVRWHHAPKICVGTSCTECDHRRR